MKIQNVQSFLQAGTVPLSFSQNNSKSEEKSEINIKKIINGVGVAAWIGMVGYGAYKLNLFNRKSPEVVLNKIKTLQKQVKSFGENALQNEGNAVKEALAEGSFCWAKKLLYNIGKWVQNGKSKIGDEMFNNLVYAFGTTVVMPFIILTSPFGKKNSSTEDKLFTIARQPLSVASTFGMQFTFDKLLGEFFPSILKSNKLEDKSLFDEAGKLIATKDGKNILSENLGKIRFNTDIAQEAFKSLVDVDVDKGGLKGILNQTDLAKIFVNKDTLKSYEKIDGKFIENKISEIIKNKNISEELVSKLQEQTKKLTDVFHKNKGLEAISKVTLNVVFAAFIGCTFLNFIYGKTMKKAKVVIDGYVAKKQEEQKAVRA